jgi:DNA-binding MarR family transcriptional regulator
MTINKQHVQLPNNMINKNGLGPKDLLVYAIIKKYMNNTTRECFPSLASISKESGYSINTVRKSIALLEKNNYFSIRKDGRKQFYKFNPHKNFEPFSYQFLEYDLDPNEKAYIMAFQQHLIKDIEGVGKTTYNNEKVAEKLNISAKTVSRLDDSLVRKGFLNIVKTQAKDPITGLFINEKFFHLDKLGQVIIWTLQNHEEKLLKHDQDIEHLKRAAKDIKILLHDNQQKDEENKKLKELLFKYISPEELETGSSESIITL